MIEFQSQRNRQPDNPSGNSEIREKHSQDSSGHSEPRENVSKLSARGISPTIPFVSPFTATVGELPSVNEAETVR